MIKHPINKRQFRFRKYFAPLWRIIIKPEDMVDTCIIFVYAFSSEVMDHANFYKVQANKDRHKDKINWTIIEVNKIS